MNRLSLLYRVRQLPKNMSDEKGGWHPNRLCYKLNFVKNGFLWRPCDALF